METLDLSRLDLDGLTSREWIVPNHLGGFASSTLCGMNTRKYHGLLVAAMSPPVRRMVLLSRVEERVLMDGWPVDLACNKYPGTVYPVGHTFLRAFSNDPFPRWAYQGDGWTVEKSLQLVHGQNTVVLSYSLLGGRKAVDFELRPLLALRGIHQLSYQRNVRFTVETKQSGLHRVAPTSGTPEVFFAHDGQFTPEAFWYLSTVYTREQERGYAGLEDVWSPGVIRWALLPGETVRFVCSTDPVDVAGAMERLERQSAVVSVPPMPLPGNDDDLDALHRAADLFTLHLPDGTDGILSQFPWTAPNVRDALIAAPGILLSRGRIAEARSLVDTLLPLVRDGLLPTEFPEDGSEALYEGVDTGLWLMRLAGEVLEQTRDDIDAARWFAPLAQIVRDLQHAPAGDAGPARALGLTMRDDGLLQSVAPGRSTSWMSAKVSDRVVTPRYGSPVELNALWFNALCTVRDVARRLGHERWDTELSTLALRVKESFNRTFWNASLGCCFDVVDDASHDPAVRPNQLLSISLRHPVLDSARWKDVIEVVHKSLLVTRGLRTLSPTDPAYHGRYVGDIVRRDHAYHQGSAFPWLLGPLVTAYVRAYGPTPDTRRTVRAWLRPCLDYLNDQGVGTLPELFDGDAPHLPGGAVADARAVGELLRCYTQDVLVTTPWTPVPSPDPAPPVPDGSNELIRQ